MNNNTSKTIGIFNRSDLILIIVIIVSSILFITLSPNPSHSHQAKVTIGKEESFLIDLSIDQIKHYDTPHGEITLEVINGQIRMQKSSCPDQLCVRQGFLQEHEASIVCIPNETVIEWVSSPQYDGVSR